MKVIVCVKQVQTVSQYLEFTADGLSLDAAFATAVTNEADECAIEEALRLVEAEGGEVVAISLGGDDAEEVLRSALAMGVHRVVRVASEGVAAHDPRSVGAALGQVIIAESPDLVLTGVQASDTGAQATGPVVAAAWGKPWVAVARELSLDGDVMTVVREFESGVMERVRVPLPALVTVQVGANSPRYGTFREKMRAKKAEIPVVAATPVTPQTELRRLIAASGDGGRTVEMLEGGAAEVAARIVELVREAKS